jgi:hypothetical protein
MVADGANTRKLPDFLPAFGKKLTARKLMRHSEICLPAEVNFEIKKRVIFFEGPDIWNI